MGTIQNLRRGKSKKQASPFFFEERHAVCGSPIGRIRDLSFSHRVPEGRGRKARLSFEHMAERSFVLISELLRDVAGRQCFGEQTTGVPYSQVGDEF